MFFNIIQDVLLHDVQLSISKLADPAEQGKRENMTLAALHQALAKAGETFVADQMGIVITKFSDACIAIKHRRNKWIAHFDRPTMLNDDLIPRMGPSREEIENALRLLREAMNCVSLHYTETTIAYEHFIMDSDGDALIRNLRRGLLYREHVERGTIRTDDFRKRFDGET